VREREKQASYRRNAGPDRGGRGEGARDRQICVEREKAGLMTSSTVPFKRGEGKSWKVFLCLGEEPEKSNGTYQYISIRR